MFHYTRVVCHEMPDCNPQATKVMWREAIPQMAFSISIVLDPLLALSAMHLHSFTPTDSQLPMVISFYLDRTLAKYRELIPQIDGDLAEPLFLAAVMLCRITWLLSHRRASDRATASKLPLQTDHMLNGLETLFLRKMDYLKSLGYSYFAREEPVTPGVFSIPEVSILVSIFLVLVSISVSLKSIDISAILYLFLIKLLILWNPSNREAYFNYFITYF